MGTIHCPGGHSFSDDLIPDPHSWLLIAQDRLFEAFDEIEKLDRQTENTGDQAYSAVSNRGLAAYRCPHCERLLVFEHGLSKPAASYRRE